MTMTRIDLTVAPEKSGRTLAAILHDAAGVSWANARGIVASGRVQVNGEAVEDPARRLAGGDRVEARFDPQTRYRDRPGVPREAGYRIVHEDPDLVVVDKDAGVLCVPAPTSQDESLVARLLRGYRERGTRQDRLWIVHRIDRFTSGLVIFARTPAAAEALVDQFSRRTPRREYLACCLGFPREAKGRLVSRLRTDTGPRRVKIAGRTGPAQTAISRYEVIERLRDTSVLRVTLETGRRNQIRVQLAEAGHPILGDRVYGAPSDRIDRPALHAACLGFSHPRDRRDLVVESPLPADIRRAVRWLRRHAAAPRGPSSPPPRPGPGSTPEATGLPRAASASRRPSPRQRPRSRRRDGGSRRG